MQIQVVFPSQLGVEITQDHQCNVNIKFDILQKMILEKFNEPLLSFGIAASGINLWRKEESKCITIKNDEDLWKAFYIKSFLESSNPQVLKVMQLFASFLKISTKDQSVMESESLFSLALICGGPSSERGISLNSARSVMDHLSGLPIVIVPLYVDYKKQFHLISLAQLYSNTPSDFDFKLSRMASRLDPPALQILLKKIDLVFPVIHGKFGEDGELQKMLESWDIPFVGHSSESSAAMVRKSNAHLLLKKHGFPVMPQLPLFEGEEKIRQKISLFFDRYGLKRAVVKPSLGGSSIGVSLADGTDQAFQQVMMIFEKQLDSEVVIEPFVTGKEFTIALFENSRGEPVALLPTEIESKDAGNPLLDFRKKYLPTNLVTYHTPPCFSESIVNSIRGQAASLFNLFKMRDFVRMDGWVLNNGEIYFTDINPLSGLEQNSFFFQQAAAIGLSHQEALKTILNSACRRYGLKFPEVPNSADSYKLPVYVLFGSRNAERQVSLMSGTNVWLKLRQSARYAPIPFFLDSQNEIWELSYANTLHHTVEEVYANCLAAEEKQSRWQGLIKTIREQLELEGSPYLLPERYSTSAFCNRAKQDNAFIFIALHGGEGENGILQKKLENCQIPFNGSSSKVSALCMDKYETGKAVLRFADSLLISLPKKKLDVLFLTQLEEKDCHLLWNDCCYELGAEKLIIKPCSDGCSAGIILLESSMDLLKYSCFLRDHADFIPPFSFTNQKDPIEMPPFLGGSYLLEPYIETDSIFIDRDAFRHIPKLGWIELTVGVLEIGGEYHALNPSITVAEGSILTLEEKFQGGTGINLTPPPEEILNSLSSQKIKGVIEKCAKDLGIENYARFDIFFNTITEKVVLIEVNSLPGLTPSTVIYHQGLAEKEPLTPVRFLERIIDNALFSHTRRSGKNS